MLIIQTTPNHYMISSQIKSNCLTIHGFNPLKPISQSMVFEKTLPKAPNNYAIRFHTGHKHNENTPYGIKKTGCHLRASSVDSWEQREGWWVQAPPFSGRISAERSVESLSDRAHPAHAGVGGCGVRRLRRCTNRGGRDGG